LTLTSTGGKHHLASRRFARSESALSLSRFLPIWSPQTLQPESGDIRAIALGQSALTGRDVWAIVDKYIQQWSLSTEGWETLVWQEDITSIISPAIQKSAGALENEILDLEILDMVYEEPFHVALSSSTRSELGSASSRRHGRLNVLVSHVPLDEAQEFSTTSVPRRVYKIVQINLLGSMMAVAGLITVPYQSVRYAHYTAMHNIQCCSLDFQLDGSTSHPSASAHAERHLCCAVRRCDSHLFSRSVFSLPHVMSSTEYS
jgi:nuclear pore complex protein Nup133